MSRIDRAEIERIATLSRLELAGPELDAMTAQMKKIVDFVSALDQLDTKDVSPRLHGADGAAPFLRADEPGPSLSVDEALANAPHRGTWTIKGETGHGFGVPPVLE